MSNYNQERHTWENFNYLVLVVLKYAFSEGLSAV